MRRLRLLLLLVVLLPSTGYADQNEEKLRQVRLDSTLIAAVKNANLDSVKSLLRQGAEPSAKDASGVTAFM